jgi:hypothetical protein
MSRLARVICSIAPVVLCAFTPATVRAQDASDDSPAHISFVDGTAVLERDGRQETAPASMPLLAGDRVRTDNGRVEIMFGDGSTLHLDASTLVDFQSDEVIRLLKGRVRVNIAGANRTVGYRVDAPSAWVDITSPGEYRVAVSVEEEIELAVLRGRAELVNEDGRTPLGAGERAFARVGASPSPAYVYNSAAWDTFDRWSESRRDTRLGVSAQYLPEAVQPYASTFNEHGYWDNVPTYGYVWYPRVRAGWRPYYYGRWTTLRPWGWTWIGHDPWAWPTHHYGRWGFSGSAWFWIPGRSWGPAWVSWAYAPGYVSWCPLGWNNRAVFGFASVNVFGGRRYDPWHAWTVVPHRSFGRGHVNINVVNVTRIDVRTRSSFVVRDSSPDFRGYAVPRSSAPIRTAVRRDGSFGGSTAFSRNPSRSGAPSSPRSDADPSATFRSRRSGSVTPTGPGYPAPARAPERAVPSRERTRPSASPADRPTGLRSPDASTPNVQPGSAPERRAVPRSAPRGAAEPDVRPFSSPSRRAAPEYRVPSNPGVGDTNDRRTDNPYRAVPRGSNPYTPSPPYGGVQRERSPYRSPSSEAPDPGSRAVPRSTPSSPPPDRGGDSPAYRPRGGYERSAPAPSGPPPQTSAPSRSPERSGGGASAEPRSGGDSGSRSRSGGQATGRAVPRGRGGR